MTPADASPLARFARMRDHLSTARAARARRRNSECRAARREADITYVGAVEGLLDELTALEMTGALDNLGECLAVVYGAELPRAAS